MRKKGISPEYIYQSVPGSFNMSEQRVFFGSKMMDIEDSIYLDNRDIVYYQQSNGEQIDFNQEITFDPIVYSLVNDKQINHSLSFDPTQSDAEKNNKTKWVFEIDLRSILRNYIYAQIKSNRSFEFVKNDFTIDKSVNESILNYIDLNIISRYYYKEIEFFVKYNSLNEEGFKRYETNYDSSIENKDNRMSSIRTVFTNDQSFVRVFFTQQNNSKEYTFDYYFNILFDKK